MRALVYLTSLVLSSPNLVAGLALLVLQHTFSTRNPIEIALDFLLAVVWGLPAAALGFVILFVTGMFAGARPFAALSLLVLNLAALGLVILRIRPPADVWEAALFLPVLLALVGCGWIIYDGFRLRPGSQAG